MASTSTQNSPSSPWIWKYDVFLSFRGEDTRYNFVDHLFAALHRRAVITFKDDRNLKKGKIISQELFKAIEESQICVVVLSKDYAASTWCLDELAKIVDCNEQVGRNQTILPVFYDVDPSEVRKQSGSYGEALARHEEIFTYSDKVQRWRKALTKVSNLTGWDARNNLFGTGEIRREGNGRVKWGCKYDFTPVWLQAKFGGSANGRYELWWAPAKFTPLLKWGGNEVKRQNFFFVPSEAFFPDCSSNRDPRTCRCKPLWFKNYRRKEVEVQVTPEALFFYSVVSVSAVAASIQVVARKTKAELRGGRTKPSY